MTWLLNCQKGGYVPAFKLRESIPAKHSVSVAIVSSNTVAAGPVLGCSPEGDLDYFCKGLCQEIIAIPR